MAKRSADAFNRKLVRTFVLLSVTTLCGVTLSFAAEKKIARSALPPAVEKTVQAQSKGATIKGFSVDNEGGKLEFEVEMTVNGHGKDVSIAPDGSILESEEEVNIDSLPSAAKSAILTNANGAKIVKVQSVSRNGKILAYEAAMIHGVRKREISVSPSGKRVSF